MLVQPQRLTIQVTRVILEAEDPLVVRMQQACRDESVDGATGGEIRIQ
ncbi:hypothetical protein [Micromonospora humida]